MKSLKAHRWLGGWTILSQAPVLPVTFTAALDRWVKGPRKRESLEQSNAGIVLTLPLPLLALGTRWAEETRSEPMAADFHPKDYVALKWFILGPGPPAAC